MRSWDNIELYNSCLFAHTIALRRIFDQSLPKQNKHLQVHIDNHVMTSHKMGAGGRLYCSTDLLLLNKREERLRCDLIEEVDFLCQSLLRMLLVREKYA